MVVQPLQSKLHGRFLHITDMHPDPHYITGASESSACHRNKPRKEKQRAGYYGTPFRCVECSACLRIDKAGSSECDSPLRLTNLTLDFLDKNWASEIDFVVCTSEKPSLAVRTLKAHQGLVIMPGRHLSPKSPEGAALIKDYLQVMIMTAKSRGR